MNIADITKIENTYGNHIEAASKEFNIPKDVISAVILAESSGNPKAVSKKNASGLMQIMPNTFSELAAGEQLDILDPATNIKMGTKYLAQMMKQNNNDLSLALSAYNAGQGNVKGKIPDIPETKNYVDKITKLVSQKRESIEEKEFVNTTPSSIMFKNADQQRNINIAQADADIQRNLDVEMANASKTINTMFQTFIDASPLTKMKEEFVQRASFIEDKDYKFSGLATQSLFKQNNIPLTDENIDFISQAKSQNEFESRIDTLKQRADFEKVARSVISDNTIIGTTMAGAVLGDPTIAMGVYALPKALATMGAAARAKTAFGGAAVVHYAMASLKEEYLAGYTDADKVLDIALGTIIDGSLAKGLWKPSVALGATPEEIGSKALAIRQSTSASLASNPISKSVAVDTSYKWYSYEPLKISEDVAGAEIIEVAKRVGYSGDEALLTTDKNIRGQVLEQEAKRKQVLADEQTAKILKAQNEQAQEKAIIESNIKKDIEAFQKTKDVEAQKLYEEQFAKSGLSKEDFDNRLATLKADIEEVSKLIDETASFATSKARDRLIAGIQDGINELRKISQSAADSLQFKFDKKFKGVDAKAKIISDGKNLAFDKGRKSFDKILKQIEKKIASQANKVGTLSKEAKKLKKTTSLDGLKRQKEIFERMKSAVDELKFSFEESLNSLMIGRFLDDGERTLFLNSLSREINKEFGSNIKLAFKDGKIVSSGDIKFDIKGNRAINPKNKMMIMVGSALALSSTAAMASDGDSDGLINIPYIIGLAMLIGVSSSAVRHLLNKRDMAETVRSFKKGLNDVETEAVVRSDPFYKKVYNVVSDVDSWRTGYLESFATVLKRGSKEQIELAKKLVRDWTDGEQMITSDSDKMQRVWSAETRLGIAEHNAYTQWLKDTGLSDTIGEKFASFGGETPSRKAFNEAVFNYIEFGGDAHKSVKDYAKAVKAERDIASDYATKSGVDGFSEEARKNWKDTYMPRFINKGNFQKIIATKEGREGLRQAIATAIKGAIKTNADYNRLLEVADSYIDIATKSHLAHNAVAVPDVEAMLKKMNEIGIETKDINIEEFIKEVHRDSDMFSRGKVRIPMNISKFKNFVAKIDGIETVIDSSVIFDRSATNAIKRYIVQTNGYASAVRLTGYASYGKILNAISNGDAEAANTMKTWVDSIFGYATFDTSTEAGKNVLAMKAATTSMLALSSLTTTKEMLSAVLATFGKTGSSLARQEFLNGVGNFIKGLYGDRNFNKTWLSEMMTLDVNGFGGATLRGDISFKATDDIMNMHDYGANAIRDTARKAGFLGLFMSRLIQLDDWYKGVANIYAATNLARVVNGKMVFAPEQMAMYGIDNNAINTLKKFLKLDKNGEILKFDFNKLDFKSQDIFRSITEKIVMDRSTWTTLGATSTGSINNSAGVMLSALTHFTSQIYTTQFIRKMKYGGVANLLDQPLWLLSGYATYYAKAMATGKEPNDEDALIYAIMSQPLMSPVAIAKSYADPAALSIINTLGKLAGQASEDTYEMLND